MARAAQACLLEVGMGAGDLSLVVVGMGEAGAGPGNILSLVVVGMGEAGVGQANTLSLVVVGMGEAGAGQANTLSLVVVGMGELQEELDVQDRRAGVASTIRPS